MISSNVIRYMLPCVYCPNGVSFSSSDEFREHLVSLHSHVMTKGNFKDIRKLPLSGEKITDDATLPVEYFTDVDSKLSDNMTYLHNTGQHLVAENNTCRINKRNSKRIEVINKLHKGKSIDIESLEKEVEILKKQIITKDEEHHKIKQKWRIEAKETIQNIQAKYEVVLAENQFIKEQFQKQDTFDTFQLKDFNAAISSQNPASKSNSKCKDLDCINLKVNADDIWSKLSDIKDSTLRIFTNIYNMMQNLKAMKNKNEIIFGSMCKAVDENSKICNTYNHARKTLKILMMLCFKNGVDLCNMSANENKIYKRNIFDSFQKDDFDKICAHEMPTVFLNKKIKRCHISTRTYKKKHLPTKRSIAFIQIAKEFDKQNILFNRINKSLENQFTQKDQAIGILTESVEKVKSENSSYLTSMQKLEKTLKDKDILIEKYKLESSFLLEKYKKSVEENRIIYTNQEKLEKQINCLIKIPELIATISNLHEKIDYIRKSMDETNTNSIDCKNPLIELASLEEEISAGKNEKAELMKKIETLECKVREQRNIDSSKGHDSQTLIDMNVVNTKTERENQLENLVENLSLEKEILSSRVLILETIREEVEILREEKSVIKNENLQLRKKLEIQIADTSCKEHNDRISKEDIEKLNPERLLSDKNEQDTIDCFSDFKRHDSGCVLNNVDRNMCIEETLQSKNHMDEYIQEKLVRNFVNGKKQIIKQSSQCSHLSNFEKTDFDLEIIKPIEFVCKSADLDPTSLLSSTRNFENPNNTMLQNWVSNDSKNGFLQNSENNQVEYDFDGMLHKFEKTLDDMNISSPNGFSHALQWS